MSPRASVTTLGRAETRASEASRTRRGAKRSRLSSSSHRSRGSHSRRAPNARRTDDRVDPSRVRFPARSQPDSMTAEGHLGKAPLLGDDAKHAALGSSEIPRISWRRAIGVFHLYLAWLIAELIALYVQSRARRCAPSADERATRARAHFVSSRAPLGFFCLRLTDGSDLSFHVPSHVASLDTHAAPHARAHA